MKHAINTRVIAGGVLLASSLQYFIAEIFTALAWTKVPYSFFHNYISDLGVPECIVLPSRAVCSPAHTVMDISFVLQGLLIFCAVIVLAPLIRSKQARYIISGLGMIFAVGIVIVGLFPGSTAEVIAGNESRQMMHVLGAFLAIGFGNLLLIMTGITMRKMFRNYAILSIFMGVVGLTAIILSQFTTLGLGVGGIERIAVNAVIIWYIITGGTLLIASSLRSSTRKYLF